MKTTVALIITMSICYQTHAQSDEPSFEGTVAYVEVGGLAGLYSVNAEQVIFKTKRWYGSARIGFGQANIRNGENFFRGVPFALHMFRNQSNHHTEFGIGVSYIVGMQYSIVHGVDESFQSQGIYVAPMVAYRFQKSEGGIFFRVQYVPFVKVKEFNDDPFFNSFVGKLQHYPGLAVGYFFSRNSRRARQGSE